MQRRIFPNEQKLQRRMYNIQINKNCRGEHLPINRNCRGEHFTINRNCKANISQLTEIAEANISQWTEIAEANISQWTVPDLSYACSVYPEVFQQYTWYNKGIKERDYTVTSFIASSCISFRMVTCYCQSWIHTYDVQV